MEQELRNKTKIIWSLEKSMLTGSHPDQVAEPNIDALRLVYTKDSLDSTLAFLKKIQTNRSANSRPLPIIVDVSSGPKVILTHIRYDQLTYGEKIIISPNPQAAADLTIDGAAPLSTFFIEGALIYIGFGQAVLKTLKASEKEIEAEVLQGGQIHPGMDVHIPSTRREPTVADISHFDIKPFKSIGIDYVILPGMSRVKEISLVRKKIISETQENPWLIIKIDNKSVYEQLPELLQVVDGVLISRQELALYLDPALVPVVCKEIIQLCRAEAKLTIIASEMLASMRHSPTPTRAEVSDVANAVLDGTDAIVLSEEIALGKHSSRSLKLGKSIITDVEEQVIHSSTWQRKDLSLNNELDAITYHATKTAELVKAKAIVCITKAGNTALRLSSFHIPIPIFAVTYSKHVERRLMLVRGVSPILLDVKPDLDEVLPLVKKRLLKYDWLKSGDTIVFVTVSLSSISKEASNLLTVQRLE